MTAGPADVAWAPVRRHLHAVRRSHGGRSVRDLLWLVYQWLLYLFVAGGVVVAALSDTIASFAPPTAGVGWWLAAASVPAAVAAVASVLLGLGPVVVRPAPAYWLLTTPVGRRELLAGRAAAVVGATGAVGAGATALVAVGAGVAAPLALTTAGAVSGVLVGALCMLVQTAGPATAPAARAVVRGALAVALLVVVAAVAATRAGIGVPEPVTVPGAGTWLATAAAAIVAGLACGAVWRRLDRAATPALTAGAPLLAALWAGTAGLEPGLAGGALRERRLLRRASVRSRRLRSGRRRALLTANARIVLRDGSGLAGAAGLVVVPWVAALLLPALVVPAVQLAGATVVVARFTTSLRAVTGSAALRRTLGGRDRELAALHCVVPFAAAVVWTLLVAPAGGSVVSLVLLPVSALAVVLRHATRPPRPATMTLYETPMGVAVPVELVADASRGPMLFAVLAAAQTVTGG